MKHISLLLSLLLSLSVAAAQSPEPPKPAAAKTTKKKAALTADAEEQLKVRRAQARSLLIALSTDARAFQDQTLRARSLARIADALWSVDAEQGRLMFRKAWEAAELADQESERKLHEEISQQRTRTGGSYAVSLPPGLRREVLKLVARHDRTLGEEFLEKLKVQKAEAVNAATQRPWRLNEALGQRLAVAKEMLRAGDLERALQFADPVLSTVAVETVNFLVDLREKDAAAADRRYAAMLAASAHNPQSDANTVSLLSSYIFTPHLFVIFTGSGTNTSQMSSKMIPADVMPELRNQFFQTAAAILLRPLPAPEPGSQSRNSPGPEGKYLVIKRLLPLFEQSAPAEMVESLRAHLNALNAVVPENTRKRDDEWMSRGVQPEKPAAEREQALLDRIDRAKTSAERDSLYIELATGAASRGDLKAREFVSKIEDSELRKQVQAYFDAYLAVYSVQKKLTDQALELVEKGELTPLQKAWALAECARILAPDNKEKALEMVEAAATEARRIATSDAALPQALLAVANALKVVDATRVWDATFDAVKAANSAEGFTGEDGSLIFKFQSKNQNSVHSSNIPEFDLEGIFRELAILDYERAVELARGFQGEGPRAVATIAIARAILEPKK